MDMPEIKRLVCERAHFALQKHMSFCELNAIKSTARLGTWVDDEINGMVLRLEADLPAVLQERIVIHEQWPKDWWQAIKERWFPRWLKRRFPVVYTFIDVDRPIYAAVCPHINVPKQGSHLMWMLMKQEEVSP